MFRAWRLVKEQAIRDRELEQIEMHERLLAQIEQKMMLKIEQRMKVTVIRALQKHVQFNKDERLIEEQHNERKAQIDNFFENLKRKVETEKT